MNTRILATAFLLLILSGCTTIKQGFKKQKQQSVPSEQPAKTGPQEQVLLFPVDSDPRDYDEPGYSEVAAETQRGLRTRPDFTFSGIETEHVRVKGVNPLPDTGLVLDLDELRSEFCYPYRGKFISDYGMRSGRMHTGVDIKAIPNDTIRAAFPGVVRMAKLYSSYGNIVVIRHYDGFETVYSHNSKNLVKVNDKVEAGTPIGLAGRTGRATTEHLHFEIRAAGEHFDPKLFIDCNAQELRSGKIYIRNIGGSVLAARSEDDLKNRATTVADNKSKASAAAEAAEKASANAAKSNDSGNSSAQYYRVKKGDTLYAIARKNSTTVKKLCQLNSIKETSILQINQRLRVK